MAVSTLARVAVSEPYVNEERMKFVVCVVGRMTGRTTTMQTRFAEGLTIQ